MGVFSDIAEQEGDADEQQQQADSRDRIAPQQPAFSVRDRLIDE